jgi:hypothetical protein
MFLYNNYMNEPIPNIIFIVPYRDRQQQQQFFHSHMKNILEDLLQSDYKIVYIHQQDTRSFNRGAMKNIGFLYVKNKYPNNYKNITLVFNDVDTMPYTKNFLNYQTEVGNIKHFYGFTFALGGIVSITGHDFERLNGFPNFWAWGFEYNLLNKRAIMAKITIDRSQFYPFLDKNIMQLQDGINRPVNRGEFDRYVASTNEGWNSISLLNYVLEENTGILNVYYFDTGVVPDASKSKLHDLRNGGQPFKDIVSKRGGRMPMAF